MVEHEWFSAPNPIRPFLAYAVRLARFPFLDAGIFLPGLGPNDLTVPFGDLLKKYGLYDMVMYIFLIA